jgi:hypothetical protein
MDYYDILVVRKNAGAVAGLFIIECIIMEPNVSDFNMLW